MINNGRFVHHEPHYIILLSKEFREDEFANLLKVKKERERISL